MVADSLRISIRNTFAEMMGALMGTKKKTKAIILQSVLTLAPHARIELQPGIQVTKFSCQNIPWAIMNGTNSIILISRVVTSQMCQGIKAKANRHISSQFNIGKVPNIKARQRQEFECAWSICSLTGLAN